MSPGRIIVLAALVALLGAAGVTTALLLRGRPGPASDRAEAQVGTARLVYPVAYARFAPGRAGGPLDRLELAFTFPDGRGAGQATTPVSGDLDEPAVRQMVFLTLRPEDDLVDPAERTAVLYARFLQPDVWAETNSLVMRRFEAGSPYEREELHFVPPEGRVFAARCLRPAQPPSSLPSTCLTTMRIGGLDIDLRYSPALLPHWDGLTDTVRKLIEGFIGG